MKNNVFLIVVLTAVLTLCLSSFIFEDTTPEKQVGVTNDTIPTFNVEEIEFLEPLNAIKICWRYRVSAPMSISLYVGDSLEKQLVFSGKIQGAANLFQVTNLHPDQRKTFFVSIENIHSKKVLYRQKLTNQLISVNGTPTPYILYSKK